jgi:hypothetical protein
MRCGAQDRCNEERREIPASSRDSARPQGRPAGGRPPALAQGGAPDRHARLAGPLGDLDGVQAFAVRALAVGAVGDQEQRGAVVPFARRHHHRRIGAAFLGRDRVDLRAAREQQAHDLVVAAGGRIVQCGPARLVDFAPFASKASTAGAVALEGGHHQRRVAVRGLRFQVGARMGEEGL